MFKTGKDPDIFWQDYEKKTGEKVLARGLGQYISGWEEFDSKKQQAMWGLIIATSGGFRFHHFPQKSWLDSFAHYSDGEQLKEKTIFIPKDRIISAELIKETKWWKKLLNPDTPHLVIRYFTETQTERKLMLKADYASEDLTKSLFN